jgi:hypothetical protein
LALIAGGEQRAALMSTKSGFIDSRLHRARSSETRFQLVNVSHWGPAVPASQQREPFAQGVGDDAHMRGGAVERRQAVSCRLGDELLEAGTRFDVGAAGLTADADSGHTPGGDQQSALCGSRESVPGVLHGHRQIVFRGEGDGRRNIIGSYGADDHLRTVPHGQVEAGPLLVVALLTGHQHRPLETGGQGLKVVTLHNPAPS